MAKATLESVWETIEATQKQLQSLTEKQAETDRQMKETDRQMKETERKIDKLTENVKSVNIELGGIGTGNGMFAEQYFINSFEKGQREFFGEKFDKIENNLFGGEPNSGFDDEYDIVFFNGKCVCIVEIKYRARKFHIDDTIDKARTFRKNFPTYAGHQIYLALGAMSFDKNVEQECINKGIAVIKQVGDTVVINDENLKVF